MLGIEGAAQGGEGFAAGGDRDGARDVAGIVTAEAIGHEQQAWCRLRVVAIFVAAALPTEIAARCGFAKRVHRRSVLPS